MCLGLIQSEIWFVEPVSTMQIISWILFCLSLIYVVGAFRLYFRHTKMDMDFENSKKLVTTGLYKYVRHPMYASLLFLGWGMFFKNIDPLSISLVCIISISLIITCKVEEQEMITRFGEEYRAYIKQTKMWIPKVI